MKTETQEHGSDKPFSEKENWPSGNETGEKQTWKDFIDKNSVHDTIFSLVTPKTKNCKQIVVLVRKYTNCFPLFCMVNLPIATR